MDADFMRGSRFTSVTSHTLELVGEFNAAKKCTFLTSSNYMNPAAASLGYLLSSLLSERGGSGGVYRSFFVNSSLEALSGAIKLARHTSVRRRKGDSGWVLIVDREGRFRPFLHPTGRGGEEAFTPHVAFVASVAEALLEVSRRRWSALVHVRYPGEAESAYLAQLVAAARRQGAMVVACDSELDLDDSRLMRHGAPVDVVVFGENLTGRQLPSGCFTMTEGAQAVWNNDVDCFAQTSTFGGNQLCAEAAVRAMERCGLVSERHNAVLRHIAASASATFEYWGQYVNPGMAGLAGVFGMDMDVQQARGSRLRTGDGREIIDCSGGFGSNLRGHNPPDLPAVLTAHDESRDYFADLERLLVSLTKFSHAFPAVSGATAVDVAVTLGMLANCRRTKIVTFDGNFSGKTLFALNLSKRGPQLTESDAEAFRPYYRDLVYVDPFGEDAEATLSAILRGGDVALVWFEMIRGGMCEPLPRKILDVIDALKEEGGYLIGVDEVLTGGWRTGESYLAHQDIVRNSDIVSLGKTLSDMTIPMAAVLVTADVYGRARHGDAGHVDRLRRHYCNNLGAHLAFNALSSVGAAEKREVFLRNQRAIENGLKELMAGSRLFAGVEGRGAMLRLVMNRKYFPFHHRSRLGNLLEMAMSHLILTRCGVFVFLLRFLHRVATDEADARELIMRLQQGLAGVTPFIVYRHALSRLVPARWPRLRRLVESPLLRVAPSATADSGVPVEDCDLAEPFRDRLRARS